MANHRLDVLGKTFGQLTVINDAPLWQIGAVGARGGNRRVVSRCACGREITLRVSQLISGQWTTCDSCTGTPRPRRGRRAQDLTGRVFGRLTVTSRAEAPGTEANSYWKVRCECGTEKTVQRTALITGRTVSCGCWQREQVRERATKHRGYRTPEYLIWNAMRQRCDNPNNPAYHHYGGRGIRYQESWRSFKAFIADIGARPSPDLSLDRIDSNGPYSKDNCRWATRVQQNQNRTFMAREEADELRRKLARYEALYGPLPED